jgi:hypothetical protein
LTETPKEESEMGDRAIDVYLNDHLAGAMLGSDLAGQIRDRYEGTPSGDLMRSIAAEIEEDRQTLLDLMDRMDVSRNPVKQATGWMVEKVSRLKLSGRVSGEPDYGAFMAFETLALGVAGKMCLWRALKVVASQYPQVASTDLDGLIARAEAQHTALEAERLAAGGHALGSGGGDVRA